MSMFILYVMYVVCDSRDHILTLKKMECQCLYIVVCDSRDHIKMTEENVNVYICYVCSL